QMVANFAAGGAAINVLARAAGARLVVVDAGIAAPFEHELVRPVRVGSGTANLAVGPAMTADECARAVSAGAELVAELGDLGGVGGGADRRLAVRRDVCFPSAAALAAGLPDVLIAAHRSPEPGHALVLDALGLEPLLDLGLRLGEGSGAALALPLLHASVAILREMATFGDAGVTDAGR